MYKHLFVFFLMVLSDTIERQTVHTSEEKHWQCCREIKGRYIFAERNSKFSSSSLL